MSEVNNSWEFLWNTFGVTDQAQADELYSTLDLVGWAIELAWIAQVIYSNVFGWWIKAILYIMDPTQFTAGPMVATDEPQTLQFWWVQAADWTIPQIIYATSMMEGDNSELDIMNLVKIWGFGVLSFPLLYVASFMFAIPGWVFVFWGSFILFVIMYTGAWDVKTAADPSFTPL